MCQNMPCRDINIKGLVSCQRCHCYFVPVSGPRMVHPGFPVRRVPRRGFCYEWRVCSCAGVCSRWLQWTLLRVGKFNVLCFGLQSDSWRSHLQDERDAWKFQVKSCTSTNTDCINFVVHRMMFWSGSSYILPIIVPKKLSLWFHLFRFAAYFLEKNAKFLWSIRKNRFEDLVSLKVLWKGNTILFTQPQPDNFFLRYFLANIRFCLLTKKRLANRSGTFL